MVQNQNIQNFDLSIVTIAYKVNSDLLKCIKSCNFSKISIEHILVFPHKEKQKALQTFKNKFLVVFDSGIGVYNALNLGISVAKGRKTLILHGDNYLTLEGPKLIEKYINNRNLQFGCYYDLDNNKKFLFTKINIFNLIFGLYPPHPGLILDKSDIKEIGFYNENYKICSDFDYYLRISQSGIKVKYIRQGIIVSPLGGLSSSGLKSKYLIILERFKILKNFYWFLFSLLPITILIGYGIKLIHRKL